MEINGNVPKEIEEELEISILLENFNYSNTASDNNEPEGFCRKVVNKLLCLFRKITKKKVSSSTGGRERSNFFGRTKERTRLLDRLLNGETSRGSFLVAGYRGVGKTRFVDEVLDDYKKDNCDVIEVRINLGSDSELSSKSVLFNMVSLLANEIDKKIFPFVTNIFLLPGSSLLGSLLPVTWFSLLLASILSFLEIDKGFFKLGCINAISSCDSPDAYVKGLIIFLVLLGRNSPRNCLHSP